MFRSLLAVLGSLLVVQTLTAQGYDTKFKAVGYKPGDVYHSDEGVHVSLNGGGLEVSLPLGPALPGPLGLRPVLTYHGKFSQSLNDDWYYGAYGEATGDYGNPDRERSWRRWSPPNFPTAALHPGKLLLYVGSNGWYADDNRAPLLAITTAAGRRTEFFGNGPGMRVYNGAVDADRSVIRSLLTALVPEWAYAATWGSVSTGTEGFRTSDRSYVIYGPRDHQIVGMWDSYTNLPPPNGDGQPRDAYTNIPTDILQIDGDVITLWRQSRNTYKADLDERGVATQMWWKGSVYHPLWIKTRSGFKVNVQVTRGTPKDFAMSPRIPTIPMVEQGLLLGWKVSYSVNGVETGYQVDSTAGTPITFLGLGGTPNTTGLVLTGATPAQVRSTLGWAPGTTDGWDKLGFRRWYDAEYTSDELVASPFTGITHGPLTTSAEWAGPDGLLSKLVTPSGKTYLFSYDTVRGSGVNAPQAGAIGSWSFNATTPLALDFWTVVTRMEVQDGVAAQSRVTSYQWAIPQPTAAFGETQPDHWTWATTQHGVAQTLPDGQTVLHVFAKPMNPGGADTAFQAQTFMAMRQSVTARYTFAAGDTSWQAFFSGGEPANGAWYKRDLFEGWDLRSWEDSLSKIYSNTEPRATRQISEVRNGPVVVTENDSWSGGVNQYAVKRIYTLAPGTYPASQMWAPGLLSSPTTYLSPAGLGEPIAPNATTHTVTFTTFETASEGLDARPKSVQSEVRKAPPSGATGLLPKESFTYETTPGKAHVTLAKRQASPDAAAYVDLTFTHAPNGLYTVNRLQSVLVSGAAPNQVTGSDSLSGAVGAAYTYDSTGRWMTRIQLNSGAGTYYSFSEQEPTHDELGRPLSQVDPNGFASSFTWDGLGRITSASPASPEVGSLIKQEDSLRKVTVDRGPQHAVYHFNGFGELIAEERAKADGTASHRLFGYDSAGRKVWETVWRPNAPDLTLWTGALPGTGSKTEYDVRGRAFRTTNANGEVVKTLFDDTHPLVVQRVVAPGTAQEATTTFTRDELGRLSQVATSPDGTASLVTQYSYDPAGRILTVNQTNPVTATSQIRTWEYDGLGRLTALVQPESGRTEYKAFTVTGKSTVTVYGAGSANPKTVTAKFDPLGRPKTVSSSDGSVSQSFFYDETGYGASNGKLTRSVDGDTTQALAYNGLNGRLSAFTTSTGGQSFPQTFDYDTSGRRKLSTIAGRQVYLALEDATSWVNSLTYTGSDGVGRSVVSLGYDPTTWMPTSLSFGNGASTLLGYRPDQVGLASMSHYAIGGGSPQAQWSYLYDAAGNLKTDGEDTFSYDLLGRLTSVVLKRLDGSSVTQGFTYDAFGNRLSSQASGNVPTSVLNVSFAANTVELNQRNQLPVQTAAGALTGAQYDEQGNLKYIWTSPGNPDTQLGLTYDALGRVIQLSDSKRGTVERYYYSADGLRVRVEEYVGGVLQKTRYNVYNDQRQLVSKYRK